MNAAGIDSATGKTEFLELLVAQLQNQDPLSPVSQEDFIAQLAQFSTLDGIEKLNASFEDFLHVQELGQGAELLGHRVQYDDAEGTSVLSEGTVQAVESVGGQLVVRVDGQKVPVVSITGIATAALG